MGTTHPISIRIQQKHDPTDENGWKMSARILEGQVTRIIARHGARGSLDWLDLSEGEKKDLEARQRLQFANSLSKLWEDDFFDSEEHFYPFRSRDFVKYHLQRADAYLVLRCGASEVAVGKDGKRFVYKTFCKNEGTLVGLPSELFGVPVHGELRPGRLRAFGSSDREARQSGNSVVLRPGNPITFSQDGLLYAGRATQYFTLTCFVKADDVGKCVVAPLHVRGGRTARESVTDAVEDASNTVDRTSSWGRPFAALVRSAAVSRPAVSEVGSDDLGLFRVLDNATTIVDPPCRVRWRRIASREEILDNIGTRVMQYGAASGLRVGTLEICDIDDLPVTGSDRSLRFYDGVFLVRTSDQEPFARRGDSGSVIFTKDRLMLGLVIAGNAEWTVGISLWMTLDLLSCQVLLDREHPESGGTLSRPGAVEPGPRNRVFIVSAQKDKEWSEQLRAALKPLTRANTIAVWNDNQVEVGDHWQSEMRTALERTKVAVLLVSRKFMDSPYFGGPELVTLLNDAQREGSMVIWIPLEPIPFEVPKILQYQAAIPPGRPLSTMGKAEQTENLAKIVRVIAEASVS